jgi:hypothetical protein
MGGLPESDTSQGGRVRYNLSTGRSSLGRSILSVRFSGAEKSGPEEDRTGVIQGVREWSPKNFRVSLSGKMWSKTFIPLLDKLNRFLKIKLFPVVLGLLKYCFVHEKIWNVSI